MADGSTETKKASPRQVAADCLREAGGNEQRAQELLRDRILTDPPLRDELLMPYVITLCRDLISECRRTIRSAIATPAARGAYGLQELARTWYDWPLSNGVLLGDATKDLVAGESQKYEALASTHKRRCNFFHKLAALVPDGKRVREAIAAERIEQLAKEIGIMKEAA